MSGITTAITTEAATTFDTVVVGNGGLGLSLGLVLARRGMRVAVVGEFDRPYAASVAAGAMNGCFGEVTPTLMRSEFGRMKLAMDVRATTMWDQWAQQLLEECDEPRIRSANGTIVILNTIGVPGIDSAGYAAIRQAMEEYKEPYEDLDPEDIEWLAPEPKSRPLKAMFIPGEHAVDTPALLRGLTTAIGRAGGTLVDAHVDELVVHQNRVTGVKLRGDGGTLQAGTVVLAAGVASHNLLSAIDPEIRDRIPALVSGGGVSLLVRPENGLVPDSVIRTPNRAFACGLHVVPRGDGVIYLGATNEILYDPINTAAIGEVNLLLSGIRQMRADLVDGHIVKINTGNRPVPLDGYPLLGSVGVDGLWMMTGTYRDGLHQSPLLAHELAARILNEAYDDALDVFTPVRPPLQGMTRAEVLETAVTHTMAVGVEHDWHLPEDFPPLIEEQFRRSFQQRLDEMADGFIPPPELLFFVDDEIHDALRRYYDAHRGAGRGAR